MLTSFTSLFSSKDAEQQETPSSVQEQPTSSDIKTDEPDAAVPQDAAPDTKAQATAPTVDVDASQAAPGQRTVEPANTPQATPPEPEKSTPRTFSALLEGKLQMKSTSWVSWYNFNEAAYVLTAAPSPSPTSSSTPEPTPDKSNESTSATPGADKAPSPPAAAATVSKPSTDTSPAAPNARLVLMLWSSEKLLRSKPDSPLHTLVLGTVDESKEEPDATEASANGQQQKGSYVAATDVHVSEVPHYGMELRVWVANKRAWRTHVVAVKEHDVRLQWLHICEAYGIEVRRSTPPPVVISGFMVWTPKKKNVDKPKYCVLSIVDDAGSGSADATDSESKDATPGAVAELAMYTCEEAYRAAPSLPTMAFTWSCPSVYAAALRLQIKQSDVSPSPTEPDSQWADEPDAVAEVLDSEAPFYQSFDVHLDDHTAFFGLRFRLPLGSRDVRRKGAKALPPTLKDVAIADVVQHRQWRVALRALGVIPKARESIPWDTVFQGTVYTASRKRTEFYKLVALGASAKGGDAPPAADATAPSLAASDESKQEVAVVMNESAVAQARARFALLMWPSSMHCAAAPSLHVQKLLLGWGDEQVWGFERAATDSSSGPDEDEKTNAVDVAGSRWQYRAGVMLTARKTEKTKNLVTFQFFCASQWVRQTWFSNFAACGVFNLYFHTQNRTAVFLGDPGALLSYALPPEVTRSMWIDLGYQGGWFVARKAADQFTMGLASPFLKIVKYGHYALLPFDADIMDTLKWLLSHSENKVAVSSLVKAVQNAYEHPGSANRLWQNVLRQSARHVQASDGLLKVLEYFLFPTLAAYQLHAGLVQVRVEDHGYRLVVSNPVARRYQPAFALMARHDQKVAILSIRGSKTSHDWLTNLHALPERHHPQDAVLPMCSATGPKLHTAFTTPCGSSQRHAAGIPDSSPAEDAARNAFPHFFWCHGGFYRAALWLQRMIGPAFERLAKEGFRVIITGHSYGAACAVILGLMFREQFLSNGLRVFAYSCPPCVDATVADWLLKHDPTFITGMVLGHDIVPRLSIANAAQLAEDIKADREIRHGSIDLGPSPPTRSRPAADAKGIVLPAKAPPVPARHSLVHARQTPEPSTDSVEAVSKKLKTSCSVNASGAAESTAGMDDNDDPMPPAAPSSSSTPLDTTGASSAAPRTQKTVVMDLSKPSPILHSSAPPATVDLQALEPPAEVVDMVVPGRIVFLQPHHTTLRALLVDHSHAIMKHIPLSSSMINHHKGDSLLSGIHQVLQARATRSGPTVAELEQNES